MEESVKRMIFVRRKGLGGWGEVDGFWEVLGCVGRGKKWWEQGSQRNKGTRRNDAGRPLCGSVGAVRPHLAGCSWNERTTFVLVGDDWLILRPESIPRWAEQNEGHCLF